MMWLSASFVSKCTVFTVNLYYLQVLAKYKKVLCKTKSVMDSVFLSVFLYWWFSFDLHFSVTKIFVNSVESGTSEKFISCDCLKLWKMIFCNISIYLMTSSNTESTLDTVVLSNILYFSYISWLKKGFLICFLVNERYQCYLLQTFIANLWIRLYLTVNPSKIFKFKILDSRSSLIAANLGSGQCGNYNFSEKVLKYFL